MKIVLFPHTDRARSEFYLKQSIRPHLTQDDKIKIAIAKQNEEVDIKLFIALLQRNISRVT